MPLVSVQTARSRSATSSELHVFASGINKLDSLMSLHQSIRGIVNADTHSRSRETSPARHMRTIAALFDTT